MEEHVQYDPSQANRGWRPSKTTIEFAQKRAKNHKRSTKNASALGELLPIEVDNGVHVLETDVSAPFSVDDNLQYKS